MPVMNIVARPNAFCGHCKDEVIIADSLACPRCGEDVDTLSLTRELRERLVPETETVAPPPALLTLAGERRPSVPRELPAAAEPVKVRVESRTESPERLALPNIPSVVAWYAGTQDTRDALAEREARLVAELRGVRQARKLLEAVLGRIEPPTPDLSPVAEVAATTVLEEPPPTVAVTPEPAATVAGERPRPTGRIALGPAHPDSVPTTDGRKPWARAWPDGCRDCGTTEKPHTARGRCQICYAKWNAAGKPS